MKLLNIIVWGTVSLLPLSQIEVGGAMVAVGTHVLRVASPGQASQLISLPFLREPIAKGRLDGVDVGAALLYDQQGAFSNIQLDRSYILRITDGMNAGAWFILDASLAYAGSVGIEDDGLAGSLADINGDETFAVHELYTLKELFPENSELFPSAAIDVNAMQVHFYSATGFIKIWHSNGQITDHVGWTYANQGLLEYAGDTAVLPGTSFLALHPDPSVSVEVRLQGVVLDKPLNMPLYAGYNFVSVQYSQGLFDNGDTEFRLDNMGLKESGFLPNTTSGTGDQAIAFDPVRGGFGDSFYLNAATGAFESIHAVGSETDELMVKPGGGFVILNSGADYMWTYGK